MAKEKVMPEGKISVSSSHPSMNILRGMGNLQGGRGQELRCPRILRILYLCFL